MTFLGRFSQFFYCQVWEKYDSLTLYFRMGYLKKKIIDKQITFNLGYWFRKYSMTVKLASKPLILHTWLTHKWVYSLDKKGPKGYIEQMLVHSSIDNVKMSVFNAKQVCMYQPYQHGYIDFLWNWQILRSLWTFTEILWIWPNNNCLSGASKNRCFNPGIDNSEPQELTIV